MALSIHVNLCQVLMKPKNGDREMALIDAVRTVKVSLVTRSDDILKSHNLKVRRIFRRILRKRGIIVMTKMEAVGVSKSKTHDGDGTHSEQLFLEYLIEARIY